MSRRRPPRIAGRPVRPEPLEGGTAWRSADGDWVLLDRDTFQALRDGSAPDKDAPAPEDDAAGPDDDAEQPTLSEADDPTDEAPRDEAPDNLVAFAPPGQDAADDAKTPAAAPSGTPPTAHPKATPRAEGATLAEIADLLRGVQWWMGATVFLSLGAVGVAMVALMSVAGPRLTPQPAPPPVRAAVAVPALPPAVPASPSSRSTPAAEPPDASPPADDASDATPEAAPPAEPTTTPPVQPEAAPKPRTPAPSPTPSPPEAPARTPSAKALIESGWAVVERDPAEALTRFRQALDARSSDLDARYGEGYALLRLGRQEEAARRLCATRHDTTGALRRELDGLIRQHKLPCPGVSPDDDDAPG